MDKRDMAAVFAHPEHGGTKFFEHVADGVDRTLIG